MGIHGLTSFVGANYNKWRKEEVSGKLIVDGYSVLFSLYTCDWSKGGQYPEFRRKIRGFFEALQSSNIEPIVVFDGVDVEGEKTALVKRRRRESIKTVDRKCRLQRLEFATGSGVLPPLSLKVFIMTLQEMQVEVVYADGEGDTTIYELANGYCCPVLSSDSDFFMYNLERGYIPFNRLVWKESQLVTGEVFCHRSFCADFGICDCDLRLVIPAIAGNDFISGMNNPQLTDYILRNLSSEVHIRQDKLDIKSIVYFVRAFSSLQNFKDFINFFPDLSQYAKDKMIRNCVEAQSTYNSGKVSTLESLRKSTSLHVAQSATMPDWILGQFRSGYFFPIHALIIGKTMLDNFIDDTSKPSCALASEPIRQFIYGLTGWQMVKEIRREELDIVEDDVMVTTQVEGYQLPSLEKMPTLSQSNRAHLLYSILGCPDNVVPVISKFGKEWHLVIAATRYWVQMCSPHKNEIEILILCFVALYSKQRLPHPREHDYFRRSGHWMTLLHTFSQWQSCYGDAVNLNQILMLPLKPISPADLFDGRLLMLLGQQRVDGRLVSSTLHRNEHIRLYEEIVDVILCTSAQSSGYQRLSESPGSLFPEERSYHSASALDWRRKSPPPLSQGTGSGRYVPPHLRQGSNFGKGASGQSPRYQHMSRGESRIRGHVISHTSEQHFGGERQSPERMRYTSGRQYEGRARGFRWHNEGNAPSVGRRGHEDEANVRDTRHPDVTEYFRDERYQGSGSRCYTSMASGERGDHRQAGYRSYGFAQQQYEDQRSYAGESGFCYPRGHEGRVGFRREGNFGHSQEHSSSGSHPASRKYGHSRWHRGN